jgi:hypothetical protein
MLAGCSTMNPFGKLNIEDKGKIIEAQSPRVFGFSNAGEWRSLGSLIKSDRADVYIIHWGGIGGYTHIGEDFIRDVKVAQSLGKTIIFRLKDYSASMHAFVPCFGDKIEYSHDQAVFMFHSVSYEVNSVKYKGNNYEYWYMWEQCINKNIITHEDFRLVDQGNEVYVRPKLGQRIVEKELE